jgi:hypothetical protein
MFRLMKTLIVMASSTLLVVACASTPRPAEELARAQSLVQQADAGNAQRFAADELNRARDKLQEAQQADKAEENDVARRRANEAAADAELASALARSRQAEQAVNEQEQSIQRVRDEIQQRSVPSKQNE